MVESRVRGGREGVMGLRGRGWWGQGGRMVGSMGGVVGSRM